MSTHRVANPIKIILAIVSLMALLLATGCQSTKQKGADPYKDSFVIKTTLPTEDISKVLNLAVEEGILQQLGGVIKYDRATGTVSGDHTFTAEDPIKISIKFTLGIRMMDDGRIALKMEMDDAAKTQKGIQFNLAKKQLEVYWKVLAEGLAKLLKGEIL